MARKKVTTLKTFEDANSALLKLGAHQVGIQKAEAAMNDELQRVRSMYENKLAPIRQEVLSIEENLEVFCEDHKDEFGNRRSKELTHGTIGFRFSPPRVAVLNRKYNWEKVIELLKKFKFGRNYLRTVVEVDKEKILAEHSAKEITDQKLAEVGVRVAQRDDFTYEIKWETIPND